MSSKAKHIPHIKCLKYMILVGAINFSLATDSITHKKTELDNLKDNSNLYSTPIIIKPIITNPTKAKPIIIKPIKAKPINTKPINTKPINTKIDFSKTYDAQKINNLTPHKRTLWEKIKGKPSSNAVLLDMLVWHFRESSRKKDRWNSQLLGISYRGIYATTFLNSFNDRAFGFGISRDYYQKHFSKNTEIDLGYQLGIVTGYDERMTTISKYTPILPVIMPSINFRYRIANVELAWILDVVTLNFSINF